MTNEQFEKFKNAVLKEPLPEYIGNVELYNPKTNCYCTAGLALRNLGYDLPKMLEESKTIEGSNYDPYGIFRKEFGVSGATIGCANDDFIGKSKNKIIVSVPGPLNYKKAPAKEIIDEVLSWIGRHQESST